MIKIYLSIIIGLLLIIIILISKIRKLHQRIEETLDVLDEIDENSQRKIHVGLKEPIAPLVFKINQYINFYQLEMVKVKKLEQGRKEMMSNLSHDVKTPLTSILGYLDALCGDLAGDEAEEYLHIVKNKAYDLEKYIDAIFIMAQIDANEIKLNFKKIDLFELLRNELISYLPRLEKENIQLEVNLPDEECLINVDEISLVRILNNLVENSLRYGGDYHFLGINAWIKEEQVFYEISDKGPGLKTAEKSKVFNRLYKSDASRSSKGHGLGLTIVKELVERMNGKIVVESTPYQKTAFIVSFPICKNM